LLLAETIKPRNVEVRGHIEERILVMPEELEGRAAFPVLEVYLTKHPKTI
jgi:hypothetical protein